MNNHRQEATIDHFNGARAQDTMFRTAFILLPLLSNTVDGFASKRDVVKGMSPPFLTSSSDQYEGNRPTGSVHGKEADSDQIVRKTNHYFGTKRHKDSTSIEGDPENINEVNEGKDISDVLPTDGDLGTTNKRKFTDLPISIRQKGGDRIKHYKKIYQLKESWNEGNSDEISNMRLRRSSADLLKLLKMFVKNPSEEAPKLTTRQNSSQEDIFDETDEREKVRKYINVKGRKDIHENESGFIKDLLHKLGEIIKKLDEKVSVDISKTKNDPGFLLIKIPLTFNDVSQNNPRSKREVTQKYHNFKLEKGNDTVSVNNTEISNNAIVKRKTFQKHSTNTADLEKSSQETSNNTNNLNKTYQANSKSLKQLFQTKINGNVVRKIDLAFKDVQKQIAPIKSMKEHFALDKTFKVGYIIANLETLQLTLKKLITNLKANKNWSDSSAQKVLDKIEISKTVVMNLMKFLRLYTESPNKIA